jgi:hypothetical protein
MLEEGAATAPAACLLPGAAIMPVGVVTADSVKEK